MPLILLIAILGLTVQGNVVTLEWDPNSETDLAGYKVYWGRTSAHYDNFPIPTVGVMAAPKFVTPPLADGKWYFAVTAYNISGLESGYSNEVSADVGPQTAISIQGPFVVDLTATTAKLSFKSSIAATSRIEYVGNVLVSVGVSSSPVTDHFIQLRNLQSGTLYSYTVYCSVSEGSSGQASGTFKTK